MLKRKEWFIGLFPVCVWAALLLVIVFQNSSAKASDSTTPETRRYIISVDTLVRGNQTPEWSQGLCAWVHERLTDLSPAKPSSKCVSFAVDPEAPQKIQGLRMIGNFQYRLHLVELTDGSLDVHLLNWRRDRNESDFEKVGWRIAPDSPSMQSQLLFKILRKIVDYDINERSFKEFVLAGNIQESSSIRLDENGSYYDVATSKQLMFEEAYARFERESSRTRNFLRATTELAVIMGVGALAYNSGNIMGAEDDFDVPGAYFETMGKKLTQGKYVRTDSNSAAMNIGHAFAGAMYYHLARTGGFSSFESFLMSLAGSTLWEYFAEFHEKVSINDQIITPLGGAAIGEALFQFSDFFNRGGSAWPNRILAGIFGSVQNFNNWLDGQKLPRAKNLDEYGFNADVMHKFDVWTGISQIDASSATGGTGGVLGWDMEIIKAPAYGKEGKGKAFLKDTVMTRFMVNMVAGKGGIQEFEALMKSVFAGFHKQDISKGPDEKLSGYSFLIGAASAFDFRSLPARGDSPGDWNAVVNVMGATVDVLAYKNGTKIRLTLDVYGDFAMVRSLAYDEYAKVNSTEGLQTVLTRENQGYYYGMGVTTSGSASISRGNLELGVEGKYQNYNSINGIDRYQEEVTKDYDLKDKMGSVKVKFSHPFFLKNARLTYSAERITHRSVMGPSSHTERYNMYMGRLVFTF